MAITDVVWCMLTPMWGGGACTKMEWVGKIRFKTKSGADDNGTLKVCLDGLARTE